MLRCAVLCYRVLRRAALRCAVLSCAVLCCASLPLPCPQTFCCLPVTSFALKIPVPPCSDIEAGAAYQDRLEGMIMRSQLLVLLQNQVFTDSQGRLLSGDMPSQRLEMQLDSQMRSFYRTRYMHRYKL